MYARLLLLVVLLSACGGDSLAGFGEPCQTADQCADGVCFDPSGSGEGTCTSTCGNSAECPAGSTCGTLADGSRACLPACSVDDYTLGGFGCVDGAQVACERAGGAAPCWQCGCPSGSFCPVTNDVDSCQPVRAEGESCFGNDECESRNCSVHSISGEPGTCLMPHGAVCSPGASNCLSCDATAAGNACARGCRGTDGCDPGEECIGRLDTGFFCRQTCASMRCPEFWTCEATTTGSTLYCAPPKRCDPTQTLPCGLFGTCHPEVRVCY